KRPALAHSGPPEKPRPHGAAKKAAPAGNYDPHRSASDAVASGPAEARPGLALWPIFAADPSRITELVEQIEQVRVTDLADIRLVPAGIAGNLYMRILTG